MNRTGARFKLFCFYTFSVSYCIKGKGTRFVTGREEVISVLFIDNEFSSRGYRAFRNVRSRYLGERDYDGNGTRTTASHNSSHHYLYSTPDRC